MKDETTSGERRAAVEAVLPVREERLFLLLSIFIGVISGLLVVSFRMAIEWLSVLLASVAFNSGAGGRGNRHCFADALCVSGGAR